MNLWEINKENHLGLSFAISWNLGIVLAEGLYIRILRRGKIMLSPNKFPHSFKNKINFYIITNPNIFKKYIPPNANKTAAANLYHIFTI